MSLANHRLYFLAAVPVIVVSTFVWFVFFSNNGSHYELLTIHPTVFVKQVSVSGTVEASHDVDLGFAQSGRIAGVYAKVGDIVPAGKLLSEVENGDLRAALAQKQATLQSQQAKFSSLQAGTRPEQIAVTISQVGSDRIALAQANAAVMNAIQNAYTLCDDAVHNKIDQFINNPRSSTPTLLFSTFNSQLESASILERISIEPMLSNWHARISVLEVSSDLSGAEDEAQSNLTKTTNLLSDINALLNAAVPTSQMSSATIAGYIASIATARSSLNTAQTTLTGAITARTASAAALDRDEKTLTLQSSGSTHDDLDAQKASVTAAEADVENARAQLRKTLVVAPFDGIVTRMDAKVGEIISPTSIKISMISNGLFEIKSFVPEVTITGLTVGNRATTTLDAYGTHVPFPAKVIAIDPAETVINGVSTYKTTLQFLTSDPRIKSGMTANIVITTEEVPNAFVIPQGAVVEKGGQSYVQVLRNSHPTDVAVQTSGSSGIGNVHILSGLSEGDSVILNPIH